MAKKKSAKRSKPTKHKAHATRSAPAKKSGNNTVGWVIAIVVIIAIVLLVKSGDKAPEVMEDKEDVMEEKGTLQAAPAPEFGKKCTIVGGVPPGSTSRAADVVTTTYKNSAKVDNEGTYFEFKDVNGNAAYRKNSEAVAAGSSITYTVDLEEVGVELGSKVDAFTIYPIQGGVACLNQPANVRIK